MVLNNILVGCPCMMKIVHCMCTLCMSTECTLYVFSFDNIILTFSYHCGLISVSFKVLEHKERPWKVIGNINVVVFTRQSHFKAERSVPSFRRTTNVPQAPPQAPRCRQETGDFEPKTRTQITRPWVGDYHFMICRRALIAKTCGLPAIFSFTCSATIR